MSDVIIHKLVIDLTLKNWAVKNPVTINKLAEERKHLIVKKIEQIFNAHPHLLNALIDKIEIDIDNVYTNDELLRAVEHKLGNELLKHTAVGTNRPGAATASQRQSTFSAMGLGNVIAYLDKGVFEWLQFNAVSANEMSEILLADAANSKTGLIHLFINNPLAIPRFLGALPTAAMVYFQAVFNPYSNKTLSFLIAEIISSGAYNISTCPVELYEGLGQLLKTSHLPQNEFNSKAIQALAKVYLAVKKPGVAGNANTGEFKEVIKLLKSENADAGLIAAFKKPGHKAEDKEAAVKGNNIALPKPALADTDDNAIYITHVGVIILHPFIAMLFAHLRLTQNGAFVSLKEQVLAVQILQFAATLKQEHTENDMILSKVLCGMDFAQYVPATFILSEEIINEVRNLLSEVIRHWYILKNTSVEGLVEGFFSRNGALRAIAGNWALVVERKDMDLLLRNLPWGMSTIKLPWAHYLINVTWD